MPITLKDVSIRLGLSQGLVSRVLNGKSDVRASTATRERIFRIAEELSYRPTASARALRSGKTSIVAAAYVSSTSPVHRDHFGHISESLSMTLSPHGYDLLVKVFPDQEAALTGLVATVQSSSCDAVALWGNEAENEEQAQLLEGMNVPFALKGRLEKTHSDWPQVDFQHEAMMRCAVERLVGHGHTRIAYLGFPAVDVYAGCLLSGFTEAVEKLTGTPANPEFIWTGVAFSAGAQECVNRWLALPVSRQPTALVTGSSSAWNGIEMALASVGRIMGEGPNDLEVVGSARSDLQLFFGQAWAYMGLGFTELGEAMAARLLIPMLTGQTIDQPVVRLLPELRPVPSWNLREVCQLKRK